jgi:hypothetical protein
MSVTPQHRRPNSVPDMTTEPNAAVAPRHRAVSSMANPYRSYSALPTGDPFLDIRTPFSHNAPVCTLGSIQREVRFERAYSTGAARWTGSLAAQSGAGGSRQWSQEL